jgi:hypothetical protein
MFDGNDSALSPSAIAAGVSRSGALQALELEVGRLKERHAEITDRIRGVIHENYGKGDDTGARAIKALEKERAEIEERLRPRLVKLHASLPACGTMRGPSLYGTAL